jgi:FtsP/CotA-like multicopper oxidase with cupredoxin domain
MGAGMGDQVTPDIPPGGSFVVRFTPNRAGTFIYHTHSPDPKQLADGLYGAIIVLAPGQKYDPEREMLMVIGARDLGFFTAKRITVNGSETFPEMQLQHGVTYRVRVINIAPNLESDVKLGSKENPVVWREIAKDGADVPSRLARSENAFVHIVSGEAYDFELRPDTPGVVPVEVLNSLNNARLAGEIVVR